MDHSRDTWANNRQILGGNPVQGAWKRIGVRITWPSPPDCPETLLAVILGISLNILCQKDG